MEYKTYVDLFFNAVEQNRDKIALKDKHAELTYNEVNRKSNSLAHHLVKLLGNAENEQKAICILAGRNAYQVISTLAVMKSGNIQVPIDVTHPIDRIRYIVEETDAVLFITTHQLMEEKQIILPGVNILYLEDFYYGENEDNINLSSPDKYIDILFTSGTTGKPKGVVRYHKGVYASVSRSMHLLQPDDKILSLTNFTFTASYGDIYTSLAAGVFVYIMEGENRNNIEAILSYINSLKITCMFVPPQFGSLLLDKFHVNLRMIVMGGDAIVPFHSKSVIVFNGYGMTEFYSVGFVQITDGTQKELPLCKPFDDWKIKIVDEDGNDVEDGTVGELWISGDACFAGYLKDEKLTKEKIVDGFFHTGDYVKRDHEGTLYYVNRSSDMIKINGLRLAPSEVEHTANEIAHLKESVCVAKQIHGVNQLCLFYMEGAKPCDEIKLREGMSAKLKPWMVPAIFIKLDVFPLNANGKTDRKALPDPTDFFEIRNEHPRNVNESILLEIARNVLQTNDFGVTDSLRLLGMDSLSAMEIVAEAQARHLIIKINDLLKYDSIRQLVDKGMSIVYFQSEEYNEALPNIVLVCGITSFNNLHYLMYDLKKKANLYVVEPIKSHYEMIFKGETMDDVVAFYTEVLDYYLNGKKVDGFIGHCYGGEIAYRMAAKWQKQHKEKQYVCLMDSPWHDGPDLILTGLLHKLPLDTLPEAMKWTIKEVDMINELATYGKPEFHGKIAYYKATVPNPADQQMLLLISEEDRNAYLKLCKEKDYLKGNIDQRLWFDKAEEVEVTQIQAGHVPMLGEQFAPIYVNRILEMIKNKE